MVASTLGDTGRVQDARDKQAGAALEAVLGACPGGGVEPGSGRALLLSLIRLHQLGALHFIPAPPSPSAPEAAPGSSPQTTASAVVQRRDREAAEGEKGQTAPAYNMGLSVHGESR